MREMWLSSWPNKRVGPQETKAELSQCRFFVGSIHFSCKTSTRVDRCFVVREGDSVFCSQKRGVVGLNDFYLMPKCCSSKEVFFLCWVDYALEGSTVSLSKCDCRRLFHNERSWHTYRDLCTYQCKPCGGGGECGQGVGI